MDQKGYVIMKMIPAVVGLLANNSDVEPYRCKITPTEAEIMKMMKVHF
jgi:hypothetical protein